jgi:hypothetical protein
VGGRMGWACKNHSKKWIEILQSVSAVIRVLKIKFTTIFCLLYSTSVEIVQQKAFLCYNHIAKAYAVLYSKKSHPLLVF